VPVSATLKLTGIAPRTVAIAAAVALHHHPAVLLLQMRLVADPVATSAHQDNAARNMGGVALQQITAELDARVLSEHVLAEALHHPAAVEALRQTKRAVALTDILAHQDNAAHNGVIAVRRQITAVLDARVHLEPADKITNNMTRGAARENVMFFGDVIDNVVRPLCSFTLPLVYSLKMNEIFVRNMDIHWDV